MCAWGESYRAAWDSDDPGEIASLFTAGAAYYPRPYAQPWVGREAIVAKWREHRDEPGETTFEWEVVSVAGDVGVVRGTTTYPAETFSNLWVIRFGEEGRASEFTEWWMQHPIAAADE